MPIVGPLSASDGSDYIPVTGSLVLFGETTTFVTGSTLVTGSMIITGSLIVSGSDTFISYGPAVFNQGGATDSNFRVETGGEDEALFIDSSNNRLYINRGETSFITTVGSSQAEALRVNAAGVVFNMDAHTANDFRIASLNKSHALFVDSSTNQVLILSGGGAGSFDEASAADVAFYVSGTMGSAGSSVRGTSLFGGDVSISGSVQVAEYIRHMGDTDTYLRFATDEAKITVADSAVISYNDSEGSIVLNADEAARNTIIKTAAGTLAFAVKNSTDQVLILSGGGVTSYNEADGADVNFYVSGSSGALGTAIRGASVFGGDLLVSGALKVSATAATGGSISGSIHETAQGLSYIVAGDNITITSASNGQVVVTGVGGSPGGSTTELQYNNGGSFDGVSAFQSDGTNITLLDAGQLRIGTGTDLVISSSNDQVYFGLSTTNKDLIFTSIEEEIMRIDESHNSVAIGINANTVAKLLVDVEDDENDHGIKIQQADSTNSKRALWIDSAAAGIYMTAKDGIQVVVDEDNGYGFLTSRNKATVNAPLVKIRDQLGDESALKVIQESADTSAFAIEIANASSTKTTLSGSGQVGIGKGTTAYNAMLHVKGISRGDGIVLEDASSTDIVVKMYESTDDGVIDVYANNSVTARIHGNGTSYINTGGNFGIGTATPAHVLSVVGAVSASLGLSGSLTRLVNGTSYLVAGSNVTIASASNGQVTISSTGGSTSPAGSDTQLQYNNDGSFGALSSLTWDDTNFLLGSSAATQLQFRDSGLYINSPANGKLSIASDGQVLVLSGGGATSADESDYADVNFFVSGSAGSNGTAIRGTSLFGGDLIVSGGMKVDGPSVFQATVDSTGFFQVLDADGSTPVLNVNTLNERVGIGTATPNHELHISGSSATMVLESDVGSLSSILMEQAGVTYGRLQIGAGGAFNIESRAADEDMVFKVNDGGQTRTALTLNADVSEVVVNQSADSLVDFRVESVTNTHMIFCDGSQSAVLIGSDTRPGADTNFFVSGSVGSRGSALISGSAVFGGDIVSSGSIYGTIKHFYHFSADVVNTNENWFMAGGNSADSPFSRGSHQWIAPYVGKLQTVIARCDATDGINALSIKFYSSAGGDATSGGTTKTSNFMINSTDIAFSDIFLNHDIDQGDSLGVSVQRIGTNPGKVNITLVIDYTVM